MTDILILIGLAVGVLWLLAVHAVKREIDEDQDDHWTDRKE